MGMTTCRECRHSISTTAKACPSCGAVQRRTSGCAILVAGFFGLFILYPMIKACSGQPSNSVSQTATPALADNASSIAVGLNENRKPLWDRVTVERSGNDGYRIGLFYATPPPDIGMVQADLESLIIKARAIDSSASFISAYAKRDMGSDMVRYYGNASYSASDGRITFKQEM